MKIRCCRIMLFSLALFGFAADQASKYGMFNYLHEHGTRMVYRDEEAFHTEVIKGVFKFHARYLLGAPPADCALARANGPVPPAVNNGALWNLGGQFKTDANKFFAAVSLLAAAGISIWALRKKSAPDRVLFFALGLILGGTLGNLYDRIVFGGVRDFLCFYWFEFPVFNVADSCLVVGATLLLLQAFFAKKAAPMATAETSPPQPPAS
ncbi:MAG TPA: signal peptidase II [Gemmataceae bacterium]|jgi:lipoprotein signal peptidase|nr:signal peptidase II [Gemmataceae bacterium]